MDAAGVCCRYFGLGDDRLYFHPPPSPRCAHATKEGRVGFTLARRRPTFRIRRKLADGRLSSAPPPPPFSTSKLSRKSSSPLSMDKEKRMRESRDKLRMLGLTSELLLLEHFFFFFGIRSVPILMIVKLTEYEVSYLTKNDIFIGKKRFNLIQFEGGNGCNKSCVQDFYFFFSSSFILSLSTLFPPYFHYLVFKDRNDIETKIFTSITNAPIMIQTAITAFFFFLLSSSFFFSFVSKESFHQPIRRSRDPSIRTTLTTLIDARRSCSPSTDETRIQRHVGWCIRVADGEIDFHRKSTERSRRKRRIIERFYY